MPPKPDPNDATFSQAFSKVARARVSVQTAETWDSQAALDPPLLVGVDLQALVVPPGGGIEHADVGMRIPPPNATDPSSYGTPPPFTDRPAREPGVRLLWSLPDGLTQGQVEASGGVGELGLRPLPNRWLVIRVDSSPKRRMETWIVESEKGRSTLLRGNNWKEKRETPNNRESTFLPEDLTVAAGGDVAWAAIYDSVENRFGFYDDLKGGPKPVPPLTYVVVGWYSVPELDPLHPRAMNGGFDDVMRELGWTVDEARLAAARVAAEQRAEAVTTLNLDARPLTTAGIDTELEVGERRVQVPATDVPEALLESTSEVATRPAAPFPTRSIYHADLSGVFPDGGTRPDAKPADAGAISFSVGGTDAEALAALIAARTPDTSAASERLLTAFSYDLIDALGQPDGVVKLDEELHLSGFESQPGGLTSETVRAGDPLTPPQPPPPPPEPPKRSPDRRDRADLKRKSYDDVLQQFADQTRPDPLPDVVDTPRTEAVPRGAPRFFVPTTPVMSFQGIARSLRHGYDHRFEPDERLACRLSGDTVTEYAGLVKGVDVLERRIEHGGVPAEAQALLEEALVNDPFFVDGLAEAAHAKSGASVKAAKARLEAERRLRLRSQMPGTDAPRLLAASLKDGVEPSPLATGTWRQPWVPLLVEWKLELTLDATLERWTLGELDYDAGSAPLAPRKVTVDGRSLLTPGGAKTFAGQVKAFLDQEDKLDLAGHGGLIDDATEESLRALAGAVDGADVLGASLEGLREQLLGFDPKARVFSDDDELRLPPPVRAPEVLTAGSARFTRLRIVDAFGRALELPEAKLGAPAIAESLRAPESSPAPPPAGSIALPPRILQPSRIVLTLLHADDDSRPASIDQESGGDNPVAGWLLADHVDNALEFFDQAGDSMGQLRHDALSGGVSWEGAPGRPGAVGAAPAEDVANAHLTRMATGLVLRDADDRAAPERPAETPLAALLRVIDTTLLTVDPFGQGGSEHLSLLVGRPIAVARAEVRIEVESDVDVWDLEPDDHAARAAAYEALTQKLFEVRLGALTRYDDGLLGYFVDDDYGVFYPVHPAVLSDARASGPYAGYLATEGGGATDPVPIQQPYVHPDPTITSRPGQTVRLTLLMDPGGAVHVTSGILPRKDILLMRDWTSSALTRLAPSFRVGPVLLDPARANLPKAIGLPAEQLWTRRDTPTTWRDNPIVAATGEAELPERSPVAQEGYLRARAQEPAPEPG